MFYKKVWLRGVRRASAAIRCNGPQGPMRLPPYYLCLYMKIQNSKKRNTFWEKYTNTTWIYCNGPQQPMRLPPYYLCLYIEIQNPKKRNIFWEKCKNTTWVCHKRPQGPMPLPLYFLWLARCKITKYKYYLCLDVKRKKIVRNWYEHYILH